MNKLSLKILNELVLNTEGPTEAMIIIAEVIGSMAGVEGKNNFEAIGHFQNKIWHIQISIDEATNEQISQLSKDQMGKLETPERYDS